MHLPLLFLLALGQLETNPPPAPTAQPQVSSILAEIKEVSPGVYDYHHIRLDKKNHTVTFPATLNQRSGLIEYALVNVKGKTHESLLKTDVVPRDIHLALLLIGLKPDPGANTKDAAPPSAIDPAYLQNAPKLTGADVRLSVAWTQDGKKKEVPLEEWIFNTKTQKAMTRGPWTYNGSMIENNVFLADVEASLFALVTDPTALVNNPRAGYNDDEIWEANENATPPVDTPVDVTITLSDPTPTPPKK
jgi:hypothetical protein